MSIETLLVGPTGHGGGEGVYIDTIQACAPAEVRYRVAGPFHHGAPGARCQLVTEVLLNRVVHPLTIPDMGLRALRLSERLDLVHVHAHPIRLTKIGSTPVVMSEGSSSAVYLGDYLGWSRAKLAGRFARTRRIYRATGVYDRLLAQERAALVYVFSNWARDVNIDWGADPDKLEVVYPGFPRQPEIERPRGEHFRFLFVGTDFERKGGYELVEAFAALAREQPDVRLTIVSNDPARPRLDHLQRSWVSPARRQRVLEQLTQLQRDGLVERRDLTDRGRLFSECYPSADAFVMPAHAEGFGFTNVEAMSFGLPVISSTAGPIPEVVEHERTGLLVGAGDVDALTGAMFRLVSERDATRRMGQAARHDFLARFTMDTFRESLGRVYRRALER